MIAINELKVIKYDSWLVRNVNNDNEWCKFVKANVINDRVISFDGRLFIEIENDVVDRNVAVINAIHEKFVLWLLC